MEKGHKNKLIKTGFQQAFSVALYCSLVGLFFFNANKIFGKQPDNFTTPIILLLLLSVSVLTCGLLVFYKPYKLYFNNKKEAAIDLVLYTTYWLFAFLVIYLTIAIAT